MAAVDYFDADECAGEFEGGFGALRGVVLRAAQRDVFGGEPGGASAEPAAVGEEVDGDVAGRNRRAAPGW